MARKPATVTPDAPEVITPGLPAVQADLNTVSANAVALAEQLGYDGSLTVGALEDEIRFYQRRSVEALLAVGTRLLILREMTPHGQFTARVELLGFNIRTAQRFMSASLRTSKSDNLSLLASHIDSAGKFLELVTLDDDDLAELADGGSVAGLKLDEIATMSASELRATLRAREKLLTEKNAKINDLAVQLEKRRKPVVVDSWDEKLIGATDELNQHGLIADEVLGKHVAYIDLLEKLADQLDPDQDGHEDRLEQVRVPISRLGDQLARFGHVVARLQYEFETRLSMYQDTTHVLPAVEE